MFAVLYCTLLAQAQNDSERQQIESEMISDPELTEYLRQLQGGENDSQNTSAAPSARQQTRDASETMDTSESAKVSCFDDFNFSSDLTHQV